MNLQVGACDKKGGLQQQGAALGLWVLVCLGLGFWHLLRCADAGCYFAVISAGFGIKCYILSHGTDLKSPGP